MFPWNRGPHRRKFLRAPGRLLGNQGASRQTDIVFWGEYEAVSRIVRRWPPAGALPTVLHEPLLSTPPGSPKRQNTDPWVFGDRFLYSNCKQLTPSGGSSALQCLTRGSVILFGSQIDGRFCLDTVFVVADSLPYTLNDAADLPVDETLRVCTIESLTAYEHHAIDLRPAQFTLYLGATYNSPVDGMFSFTPTLSADASGPRFARPEYSDRRFVNPQSTQSPSGAKLRRPTAEVREAWFAALEACRDADLDLAINVAPLSEGRTKPPCQGTVVGRPALPSLIGRPLRTRSLRHERMCGRSASGRWRVRRYYATSYTWHVRQNPTWSVPWRPPATTGNMEV